MKTHALRGAADRLAMRFGSTRFDREWRGGARLRRAGLKTAPPLASWIGLDARGRRVECLATVREDAPTLLEALAGGMTHSAKRRLAECAGSDVGRLVRAGLVNRDHKPSNALASGVAGEPRLLYLDAGGVRRAWPGRRRAAVERTLFALLVEFVGVERAPSRAQAMRCLSAVYGGLYPGRRRGARGGWRAWRNARWRSIEARLDRHGDPTPKVNPLDPPAPRPAGG